jgi:hypothetical protein
MTEPTAMELAALLVQANETIRQLHEAIKDADAAHKLLSIRVGSVESFAVGLSRAVIDKAFSAQEASFEKAFMEALDKKVDRAATDLLRGLTRKIADNATPEIQETLRAEAELRSSAFWKPKASKR